MEDSHSLSAEVLEEIVRAAEAHEHEHEHHHHDHAHEHEHEHHHEHDHEHHHEHEHEHEHHHDHDHEHEHGEGCTCGCHDHDHHGHHHADEVFQSWGRETTHKYTEAQILSILNALGDISLGTVLRAKGIVAAEEGEWIHFDFVPGQPEVRRGPADYTGRLCVIGADLDEDRIADLFGV